MNNQDVAKEMIDFILEKETELHANKLSADPHAKADIVNSVLTKLDQELSDEDK